MSTYEEEHNVRAQEEAAARERASNTTQPPQRSHETLATMLSNLFTGAGTRDLPQETDLAAQGIRLVGSDGEEVSQSQAQEFARAMTLLQDLPIRDSLLEQLSTQKDIEGVSQEFIDSLERVSRKSLRPDQTCSICTSDFLDDPHPLVVRLPCEGNHRFDLECIAPWLKVHSTCPLCRKNLVEKKKFEDLPVDSEEEEDDWEMYG